MHGKGGIGRDGGTREAGGPKPTPCREGRSELEPANSEGVPARANASRTEAGDRKADTQTQQNDNTPAQSEKLPATRKPAADGKRDHRKVDDRGGSRQSGNKRAANANKTAGEQNRSGDDGDEYSENHTVGMKYDIQQHC
uniref:High mobility group nucleosome-binding domain-containing protein 5-like n=1 Tax=Heterorhabditis bacteriophora TaxID=37862 RepID=A0A1I7XMX9_HETBA